MSHDHLDDRIKDGFGSQEHKAPEGLWSGIQRSISDDPVLDGKVKDGFSEMAGPAPDHVWDGINKQLNIDRAWDGVLVFLNRRTMVRRVAGMSAMLLLLAFVWAAADWYSSGYLHQLAHHVDQTGGAQSAQDRPQAIDPDDASQLSTVNEEASDELLPSSDVDLTNEPTEPTGTTSNDWTASDPISDDLATGANDDAVNDHHDRQVAGSIEEVIPGGVDRKGIWFMNLIDPEMPDSRELPDYVWPVPVKDERWSVGAWFSYNRTWIVNNDTRSGRDKLSLISTASGMAQAFGVDVRYRISDRHSVVASVFHSVYHQQFSMYQDGLYLTRRFELAGNRFSTQYRIDFDPFSSSKSTIQVSIGPYIGLVSDARMSGDKPTGDHSAEFSGTHYGFTGSIGQTIKLGVLRFEYGVRGEYGLSNMFSGNTRIPDELNLTRAHAVGGFIALNYIF